MDSSQVIMWMVAAGVCFIAFMLYAKQFKIIFRIIRNGVVGCLGIVMCNVLLASAGLSVGINVLTAFIVGILGIPGLLLLYITQMIVR